jgi:valyl-tRNA synthetase
MSPYYGDEQMMARLLAEIRTNREEMRAGQEHMKEEMMAKLNAHYKRMIVRIHSQLEAMEAALDISEERLNKMDTTDLEANREKLEALAEQQDVPKAEAAVKISEHCRTDMATGT